MLLTPIIIGIFVIGYIFSSSNQLENNVTLSDKSEKIKLDIKSLFNIYGFEENLEIKNGKKVWNNVHFELNPENTELYEKLNYQLSEKTIVIYPIFTAAAYSEPGFYTYFREECDEKCLTIELQKEYAPDFTSSGNGFQVLKLLGYEIISDIDVDQDPTILEKYDKVILLHNEYVTQSMFNSIVNHPHVIYLYPNALYAEIEVDYKKNEIALIRGHGYPESTIMNGFDWEFDNTHPYEYDHDCENWEFYRIPNGEMLNCYPERELISNIELLKKLKDLVN